jgi:hypothetical protein
MEIELGRAAAFAEISQIHHRKQIRDSMIIQAKGVSRATIIIPASSTVCLTWLASRAT